MVLAVVLIAGSIIEVLYNAFFLLGHNATIGVVTKIEYVSGDPYGGYWNLKVKYHSGSNEYLGNIITGSSGDRMGKWVVGKEIKVYYESKKPGYLLMDDFLDNFLVPVIVLTFGVFILLAILFGEEGIVT